MVHRIHLLALSPLAAALLLAGCTPAAPDLATGDAALNGAPAGDTVAPVAVRPVMQGTGGQLAPACEDGVALGGSPATVLWAPVAGGPAKATLAGGTRVRVCDRRTEGYVGIVYPTADRSLAECGPNGRVRFPREYQGPCHSGWIAAGALTAS